MLHILYPLQYFVAESFASSGISCIHFITKNSHKEQYNAKLKKIFYTHWLHMREQLFYSEYFPPKTCLSASPRNLHSTTIETTYNPTYCEWILRSGGNTTTCTQQEYFRFTNNILLYCSSSYVFFFSYKLSNVYNRYVWLNLPSHLLLVVCRL